jgi:hypothetical protein
MKSSMDMITTLGGNHETLPPTEECILVQHQCRSWDEKLGILRKNIKLFSFLQKVRNFASHIAAITQI